MEMAAGRAAGDRPRTRPRRRLRPPLCSCLRFNAMALRESTGFFEGRRLPVGAEATPAGVHFRVWAPARRTVDVVAEGGGATALGLGVLLDVVYSHLGPD